MAKKGRHLSQQTKQLLSRLMKGRHMKQSTKMKIKRTDQTGHSQSRKIHLHPHPHRPYKRIKPYSRWI